MTVLSVSAEIFACHSAACRPPGSGGTGGSGGGKGGYYKSAARIREEAEMDSHLRNGGTIAPDPRFKNMPKTSGSKAKAFSENAGKMAKATVDRRAKAKASADLLAKVDWTKGADKPARVRGGKPDPIAAKLMAKGKFVPGATPIGETTRIKNGAVHIDGKQVTGKITKPHKTYGGYQATMRGSEHTHWDNAKKKRVQNVVIGDTKIAVARAAQEAIMAHDAYMAHAKKMGSR